MGNDWTQLTPVPISYVSSIIQPIHIEQDDMNYILMINSDLDEVIKYNLLTNKYTKTKCINNNATFCPSTACFYSSNNMIVAIDSYKGTAATLQIDYDENQYEWDIKEEKDENDEKRNENHIGWQSTSCYVYDTDDLLNEMHIVGGEHNNKYFKYKYPNTMLTKMHQFHNEFCLTDHGMIYSKFLKK
eukprot:401755_1